MVLARVLLTSANFGEPQKQVTGTGSSIDYKELQMTFEILPSGKRWDEFKMFDIGYEQLNGDGSARVPILSDETKTRITRPHPLDGEGHKTTNPTDTPAELTFVRYAPASWSGLSLS